MYIYDNVVILSSMWYVLRFEHAHGLKRYNDRRMARGQTTCSLGGTASLKPATHLAILYADRGEFDRQRFSLAIDADTPGDFFGSFENSCDKSPNLMGWLYWRFAAINVENRGNGHTWRMPANLIADI